MKQTFPSFVLYELDTMKSCFSTNMNLSISRLWNKQNVDHACCDIELCTFGLCHAHTGASAVVIVRGLHMFVD